MPAKPPQHGTSISGRISNAVAALAPLWLPRPQPPAPSEAVRTTEVRDINSSGIGSKHEAPAVVDAAAAGAPLPPPPPLGGLVGRPQVHSSFNLFFFSLYQIKEEDLHPLSSVSTIVLVKGHLCNRGQASVRSKPASSVLASNLVWKLCTIRGYRYIINIDTSSIQTHHPQSGNIDTDSSHLKVLSVVVYPCRMAWKHQPRHQSYLHRRWQESLEGDPKSCQTRKRLPLLLPFHRRRHRMGSCQAAGTAKLWPPPPRPRRHRHRKGSFRVAEMARLRPPPPRPRRHRPRKGSFQVAGTARLRPPPPRPRRHRHRKAGCSQSRQQVRLHR